MDKTYRKDYFWDFCGWNNVPSRVHIRIVHEKEKPLIVVCSQPLYGAGTSVQNAYKILRKHLNPIFKIRLGYKENQTRKEEVIRLIDEIKNSKRLFTGVILWGLSKLAACLSRDAYHLYQLRPDLQVVWLEHWPPGTDLIMGPPDDYLLVRENNCGEPIWFRIDADELIEAIGYEPSSIRKGSEIFENGSSVIADNKRILRI